MDKDFMPPCKGRVDEKNVFAKCQRCLFSDPSEEEQKLAEVLWHKIKGTTAAGKCVGSL